MFDTTLFLKGQARPIRKGISRAIYYRFVSERCEYCDFKSEMIRYRLVVGICNTALFEKLQMDLALTFEKPYRLIIRERVAVHKQQDTLKDSN